MFGQANAIPPIPRETARSARAIFGRNNFYIQVGEHLKAIVEDIGIACLLEKGAILPQTTFFQYLENLTDTQAVDAIRTRLDWKFALHLPVYSPMFHENTLCEFRQKILIDPVYQREFQKLIDRLITVNPSFNNRSQGAEILELVSMVCSANRLGFIHGAICQAIGSLACNSPVWLRKTALPHWYGRYNQTAPGFDFTASINHQELSIQEIGADIHYLLEEVRCSGPAEVNELQELRTLDHIWMRQLKKSNQLSNDKDKVLTINDCDFCICKERINMDGKYQ
jgi:transposase